MRTNATAQSLQARWFIPLEMRVISGKKEALQASSILKNVAWSALTFRFEEIEKSINSTRDTPMTLTSKIFFVCKDFQGVYAATAVSWAVTGVSWATVERSALRIATMILRPPEVSW